MKIIVKGKEAQIDDKYLYLLEFCTLCIEKNGYLRTCCNGMNLIIFQEFGYKLFQKVLFHRLIFQIYIKRKLEKEESIDHINGDKLDNRIENLRILTNSQNAKNKKLKEQQIYHNICHNKLMNCFTFTYIEKRIYKHFRELHQALNYFIKYDNNNGNILTKFIYNPKPISEIENIILEPAVSCVKCKKTLWSLHSLKRHQKTCK